MASLRQLCTFHIDDMLLGVDVSVVQEVIQTPPVTRVPLAKSTVAGLINLRGQIVTAIDLRVCLQRSAVASHDLSQSLIIRTESAPFSFLVDRIGDVLDIDEATFTRTPESINPSAAMLISGAYRMPDSLLLILNPGKTINHVTSLHAGKTE